MIFDTDLSFHNYFNKVAQSDIPVIYYDSVHRVLKNLKLLSEMMPEVNIIIGRELTKLHEEIVRGSAEEVIEYFDVNNDKIRGEFVVVVNVFSVK